MKQKNKKNIVLQGTVNSLIETKDKQKAQLGRLSKLMKKQDSDLDKVKATKGGAEAAKVKKELKEAIAKNAMLVKQVESLTVEKAKAEAEVARVIKHNDFLEEAMGRKQKVDDKQKKKIDVKCRDFEERGVCSYRGGECKFLHPNSKCQEFSRSGSCYKSKCLELHRENDCMFWMEGHCRFSNEECKKGDHRNETFNTKPKRKTTDDKIKDTVTELLKQQQQRFPQQTGFQSQQQF